MKRPSFYAGLLAAVEFLPLRPLLYTVGAAAALVGIFGYVSKHSDKRKTVQPEDTSVTEAAEVSQDQATGCAQIPPPAYINASEEFERDQEYFGKLMVEYNKERDALSHNIELLQISLCDTEKQHSNAVKVTAQLMHVRTKLMSLVETLQDKVQDIKNPITEIQNTCDEVMNQKMSSSFKTKCKQEWQPDLKEEMTENLEQCDQFPLALLCEAEEKHQQALVTIALLESERTNLKHQLDTLQDTTGNMVQLFFETQKKNDEQCARERRANRILKTERDFLTLRLKHCEELLMKHDVTYFHTL